MIELTLPAQFTATIKAEEKQRAFKLFWQWAKDQANYGFYTLPSLEKNIQECKVAFEKFRHKKVFLHVGLGGSHLGPELIAQALGDRPSYFLSNLDSDAISKTLASLRPADCLCYIVSKSGHTLETKALLSVLMQWLSEHAIPEEQFSQYFVFCTGPHQNPTRQLAHQLNCTILDLPSELGGRYSVLSPVGIFPALFQGLSCSEILKGVKAHQRDFEQESSYVYPLFETLAHFYQKGVDQTVLMPYSSLAKGLSLWFVQLFSESLGKINHQQKNSGFTALYAYGSCDQHSQLQLFMEGPINKFILLLKLKNNTNELTINKSYFSDIQKLSLTQILNAQCQGTFQALREKNRPCAMLEIETLAPAQLSYLFHSLQCLTVLMGAWLQVNPFDQPGVELAKKMALNLLDFQRS